jgi:transposase-like protein
MYHLEQIPSETHIQKFLKQILFGNHVFCPECRSFDVIRYETRYRCRRCRIKFSLLSHTFLKDSRIPLERFWVVLWCWTRQEPVLQTQDIASLSEKAVRHWFDLFRANLPQDREVLSHMVQLDEAYFGRFGKVALLMGKQIGRRKLAYEILRTHAPAKLDAALFVKRHIEVDTKLNTDGSAIYKGIEKRFPITHTVDIHKKFEFTNTSEIEGMFGVLRTFIRRMYHHVSEEKLDEYVCEFYFRFCRPEMFKSPHEYLKNTLVLVPSG